MEKKHCCIISACRMAAALSAEVGVAPENTERLSTTILGVHAASSVGPVIGAMRDACRSVTPQ
jgi:hypothetical protein